jgi:Ca2+-transporting ATPase
MGSGTDVGKEAADMVLADDNFATIVAAIREGRRIYLNLQKIVWFLLSANAAEVLLITVGLLAFGHLGPALLATQILWINLVTDGLPVLALAVDPAPPGVMERSPRRSGSLLGRAAQVRILARGAILAGAAFSALLYGYVARDLPWSEVRTLVFTTLVGVQLVYALLIRREVLDAGSGHLRPNPWLAMSIAVSFALQIAVVSTEVGNELFDTSPLALSEWVVAVALSIAAPLVILVLSRLQRSRRGATSEGRR